MAAFARGGVEAIAIGAPTGPFGAIYRRTDYAQPYFDTLDRAAVYPVFHVLAGLTPANGCPLVEAASTRPAAVEALAYRTDDNLTVWLTNLTAGPVSVKLNLAQRRLSAAVIDAENFARATTDPDCVDALTQPVPNNSIALDAYAVARLLAA